MGPTCVVPGTPYYEGMQGATEGNDTDLGIRDRSLEESAASFGPGFGQQKLLVPSGTVAVLHFGLYHRGSRRMPDSIFRNMFKTQWFRTSAPTAPSWVHQETADELLEPFADSGASQSRQVVWETIWDWMKGGATGGSVRDGEDVGSLVETVRSGADEVERVGAGYELASLVRNSEAQGSEALRELLSMAQDQEGSEGARRASMYGLASVGDPAASGVAAALEEAVAAGGNAVATNLAYALGEAVRSTDVAESSLQTLQTCIGMLGAELPVGSRDPTDDKVKEIQTVVASCVQAMGCIGERVVAGTGGDEELTSRLVTQIAETLLPWTTASKTLDDNPGVGTTSGAGQAREGAAAGLLRLTSGGLRSPTDPRTVAQVIDPLSPAHHDDDRFVPAMCEASLERLRTSTAQGSAARRAVLEPLLAGAAERWQELAREAAATPPEPWLTPGAPDHVRWQ